MIKKRWKSSDLFTIVLVNKKIGVSLYKTKIDDEKCGCIVNGNPFRGM